MFRYLCYKIQKRFLILGMIVIVFLASFVSVAFGSWTINSVGSASGSRESYDICDLNGYFEFEGDTKIFEYTSSGLIEDETIDPNKKVNSGYRTIPFQINIGTDSIREHLPAGATGFELQTVLVSENQNIDLFSDSVASVVESKIAINLSGSFQDADYSQESVSIENNGKESFSVFLLDPFDYLDEKEAFFSIQYKITFHVSDFENEIYNKLENGCFLFSFKAGGIFRK